MIKDIAEVFRPGHGRANGVYPREHERSRNSMPAVTSYMCTSYTWHEMLLDERGTDCTYMGIIREKARLQAIKHYAQVHSLMSVHQPVILECAVYLEFEEVEASIASQAFARSDGWRQGKREDAENFWICYLRFPAYLERYRMPLCISFYYRLY